MVRPQRPWHKMIVENEMALFSHSLALILHICWLICNDLILSLELCVSVCWFFLNHLVEFCVCIHATERKSNAMETPETMKMKINM